MLFQHQFYRSCIEKKDGISGSTFSNPYLWEAQLFLCDQWHRLRAEWETRQVIQQVCNHSFRWEESMKNFLVSSFALSHLFGCRCSVMGTCEYREGRGSPSLEALGLETPGSFFQYPRENPICGLQDRDHFESVLQPYLPHQHSSSSMARIRKP